MLIAASFLTERIALPLTPRSFYTVSTPIVLLTGLVGGPLRAPCGRGHGRRGRHRRLEAPGDLRRAQLGPGLHRRARRARHDRRLTERPRLRVDRLCRLPHHERRRASRRLPRPRHLSPLVIRPGTVMDVTETLVSLPILALLLQSNDTSGPTLMLLTIAALLVALYFGTRARAHYQAEIRKRFEEARTAVDADP